MSIRLGAQLAAYAARCEIPPSSLIAAAWACLLCRYFGERSLTLSVIDASRAGRQATSTQRAGRIRCSIDARQTFTTLARSLESDFSEGAENPDDRPFAALVWNEDGRVAALSPAPHVLTLAAGYSRGELSLRIWDHTDARSEAFISRLSRHLSFLLEGMLERPDDRLEQIPFLPVSERDAVLRMLNPRDTACKEHDETLVQLFEAQVEKSPDSVAVEHGDIKLTYRELNERADRLRCRLIAEHERQFHIPFAPETRVALLLGRGPLQIIAALAVLKAGGAYVPLDPAYPAERLSYMLQDCGAVFVFTEARLATRFASTGATESSLVCPHAVRVLTIDDERAEQPVPLAPPAAILPNQLAYVIYTSGSTGTPRGVLIEHAGVATLAHSVIQRFSLGPGARLLQIASFSFDASVFEWVGALTSGATLVLISEHELPPREDVADLLERKQIHVALIVPSVLRTMKKRPLPHLRMLLSGAEPCTPDIARDWAPGRTLINAYGPTEVSVLSTVGEVSLDQPLHIGRAIAGRKALVLNSWLEQLPAGAVGELCVTGAGLARGYLNNPAGSAQSFVCVPESLQQAAEAGARMYRTGDLVRILEDGNLEYVSRIDNQVKIRGYRIEPGEVEAHLHEYPGIRECAVIYQTHPAWSSGRLVVFFTSSDHTDDAELAARLERHLQSKLPPHMVPQHYRRLERLPVTANGKIDRARLSQNVQLQDALHSAAHDESLTQNERILQEVWREVLGLRDIGIDANFFALGGDSISAIAMVRRAEERGLLIRGAQVVEHPQIRALAPLAVPLAAPSASHRGLPVGEHFDLTPIQHWFFERELPAPAAFSQFQVIRCRDVDEARLERALARLLERHDAFSLCFPVIDGRRQAKYLPAPVQPTLLHASLVGEPDAEGKLREIYAAWQREFDLETGKTVAFGIVRGHPDGAVRLFLALHHLIVDGVSWRILVEDWKHIYFKHSVAQPGVPLHVWRRALGEYASTPETQQQLPYWIQARQAALQFQLPMRAPVQDAAATRGVQLRVSRPMEPMEQWVHDGASQLAPLRRHRMEIFLAAFVAALSEWSGAKRVAFQLEGHGREERVGVDAGRSVGWFTALFPVLIELPEKRDPVAIVRAVQAQYQSIPDRGLSFGVLRYLHPDPAVRDALGGPDSAVLFNYLGSFTNPTSDALEDWILHDEDTAQDVLGPENPSHALFEVNCSCVDDRFVCQVGYSPSHFHEPDVRAFLERFFEWIGVTAAALGRQTQPWSESGADEYAPATKTFPLTSLQEGMLFYDRAGHSRDHYFVQSQWRYDSVPDADRMKRAFAEVCAEAEVLRTYFRWDATSRPVQCVAPHAEIECRWTDLSKSAEDEQDRIIEQLLREDRAIPFDLARPGAMRLHWIRRGSYCDLLMTHHHIILDGWSLPLILNRAHELYAGTGQDTAPPRRISFENFVRYQRAADPAAAERYFAKQLASGSFTSEVPVTRTPGRFDPLKAVQEQGEAELFLDAEAIAGLAELARKEGITPATVVLFAFGVVLSAYNRGRDVIFGTTLSGRNHDLPGLEGLIGLTLNTLPIFFRPARSASIRSALQALQIQIAALNEHSLYPLRAIVDPAHGTQVRFSAVIVFENYPQQNCVTAGGLRARLLREIEKNGYPLSIACRTQDEGLHFKLMYDQEVFSPQAMQRLLSHLGEALQNAAAAPTAPYSELAMLSAGERRALIGALAGPEGSKTADRIEHRFRAQTAKTPERPALVSEHVTLSYADVDRLSDEVCDLILGSAARRPPPEALVAVIAERSSEFVYGILGVLKAGCAYLPLDPGAPAERTNAILKDAGVRYILRFQPNANGMQPSCEVLPPANAHDEQDDSAETMFAEETADEHASPLAYVMYTSGSTGKPRGVLIEHAGVLRLVSSPNYVVLESDVRILQTGALGFDASTFEIWGALLNGGTLYFVPWHCILDPAELAAALRKYKINLLWLTTALFHRLASEDPSLFAPLKHLIVGGEVLQAELASRVKHANPGLLLSNVYGPTENTTFSTFYHIPCDPPASVPIGRIISGTFALVLDPWLEQVPAGVIGELCVGGAGLARGYLNAPAESGRKFIRVPARLAEHGAPQGERLYRTGDLVRLEEDGNLSYIGRLDEQLKILGQRVEPAEIEQVLNQHARVRESAVVLHEDPERLDGRLVAYCVCSCEPEAMQALADELDVLAQAALPAVMIPEGFVFVTNLPLTSNGKVDRAVLKRRPLDQAHLIRPTAALATGSNDEAMSERERVLRDIWQEVLGRRGIGLRQSFYALGGDSLNAIRIASALRRRGYQISVQDVLNFPTIERCSAQLRILAAVPEGRGQEEQASRALDSMTAGTVTSHGIQPSRAERTPLAAYPLGPAQYRFFGRNLPNPNHFVSPVFAKLARRLDASVLPKLLTAVLHGQDGYNVYFRTDARLDRIRQVYRAWVPADYFQHVVLSEDDWDSHRRQVTEIASRLCRSFDLGKGPLFRVVLVENFQSPGEQLLFVVFHHLISDGVSLNVFFERLRQACLSGPESIDTAERGERANSYLSWCLEVDRYARTADLRTQRQYWERVTRSQAAGKPAQRPPHSRMRTLTARAVCAPPVAALARASARLDTTPFVLLLALFLRCLRRASLPFETVHIQSSQREQPLENGPWDMDRMVGYFSAALPFRAPPPGELQERHGFDDFVLTIADQLRETRAHGFDYLVLQYVLPALDPEHRPLQDSSSILFHYLSEDPLRREDDFYRAVDLTAGPASDPANPSHYLLNFTVSPSASGIELTAYYSPDDYTERTVRNLLDAFRAALNPFLHPEPVMERPLVP
ncbi:amino acid adenylation domain-containing protein [Sorangium sp. So ce341]|uniref:amino acid adenylation domain-containing protein n=1 Tax=Sorangium sp. So ce341 TaxID=3133302 RepID=UPI003F5F6EAC